MKGNVWKIKYSGIGPKKKLDLWCLWIEYGLILIWFYGKNGFDWIRIKLNKIIYLTTYVAVIIFYVLYGYEL